MEELKSDYNRLDENKETIERFDKKEDSDSDCVNQQFLSYDNRERSPVQ